MSEKRVPDTRIIQRGRTHAEWLASDEIPLINEILVETDTKKIKLGDGVNTYAQLPYPTLGVQSLTAGTANVSVDDTDPANLTISVSDDYQEQTEASDSGNLLTGGATAGTFGESLPLASFIFGDTETDSPNHEYAVTSITSKAQLDTTYKSGFYSLYQQAASGFVWPAVIGVVHVMAGAIGIGNSTQAHAVQRLYQVWSGSSIDEYTRTAERHDTGWSAWSEWQRTDNKVIHSIGDYSMDIWDSSSEKLRELMTQGCISYVSEEGTYNSPDPDYNYWFGQVASFQGDGEYAVTATNRVGETYFSIDCFYGTPVTWQRLNASPTKTSDLTNDGADGANPFIASVAHDTTLTGDGTTNNPLSIVPTDYTPFIFGDNDPNAPNYPYASTRITSQSQLNSTYKSGFYTISYALGSGYTYPVYGTGILTVTTGEVANGSTLAIQKFYERPSSGATPMTYIRTAEGLTGAWGSWGGWARVDNDEIHTIDDFAMQMHDGTHPMLSKLFEHGCFSYITTEDAANTPDISYNYWFGQVAYFGGDAEYHITATNRQGDTYLGSGWLQGAIGTWKKLYNTYTAGEGLEDANSDGTFSIKIDGNSTPGILTASADGLKIDLSGNDPAEGGNKFYTTSGKFSAELHDTTTFRESQIYEDISSVAIGDMVMQDDNAAWGRIIDITDHAENTDTLRNLPLPINDISVINLSAITSSAPGSNINFVKDNGTTWLDTLFVSNTHIAIYGKINGVSFDLELRSGGTGVWSADASNALLTWSNASKTITFASGVNCTIRNKGNDNSNQDNVLCTIPAFRAVEVETYAITNGVHRTGGTDGNELAVDYDENGLSLQNNHSGQALVFDNTSNTITVTEGWRNSLIAAIGLGAGRSGSYSGSFITDLGLSKVGQVATQSYPPLGVIYSDDLSAIVPWKSGYYVVDEGGNVGIILDIAFNVVGQVSSVKILVIGAGVALTSGGR
ncbi:hypothetical protein FACS1894184_19610 [Clostridia bacterium]|nr:hypothetical protein FACS1894184_19610 [Clostridia bacterium]